MIAYVLFFKLHKKDQDTKTIIFNRRNLSWFFLFIFIFVFS